MSKSIHITRRNFKGLSVKELDEQANEPNSELKQWSEKSKLKNLEKKIKNNNQQRADENCIF